MSALDRDGEFDAAFCFGNSFGYLDDAGNEAFLAAVGKALKPGGRFAIDYGQTAESIFPRLEARQEADMAGFHFVEDTRYDMLSGRIENRFTFSRDGKTETKLASQRVYTLERDRPAAGRRRSRDDLLLRLAGRGAVRARLPPPAHRGEEGRARSTFASDHRLISGPRALEHREPEALRLDREVRQDGRADEVQGEVGRVRGFQTPGLLGRERREDQGRAHEGNGLADHRAASSASAATG